MNCNSTAFESPFEEQIYFSSTVQLVNNIQVCFLGIQSVFRILEPLQQSGAFNQFFHILEALQTFSNLQSKPVSKRKVFFFFFGFTKV